MWSKAQTARARAAELSQEPSEQDPEPGHLRVIAQTRHWLFHHTDHVVDGQDVLRRMGRTLQLLASVRTQPDDCDMKAIPDEYLPPDGWGCWQERLVAMNRAGAVQVCCTRKAFGLYALREVVRLWWRASRAPAS